LAGEARPDASHRAAVVYLPGESDNSYSLNTSSIFRGCEGNWFRANVAWQTAFRNAVRG
jgi:hypothetical protein